MSHSATNVKWAAVAIERRMCSAIFRLNPLSGTRSSGPAGAEAEVVGAGATGPVPPGAAVADLAPLTAGLAPPAVGAAPPAAGVAPPAATGVAPLAAAGFTSSAL